MGARETGYLLNSEFTLNAPGEEENALPADDRMSYSQKHTRGFQDQQTSPCAVGDLSPPQTQRSRSKVRPGARGCPHAKTEQSLKSHEEGSELNKAATRKHSSQLFLGANKRHFTGQTLLSPSPGAPGPQALSAVISAPPPSRYRFGSLRQHSKDRRD